MPGVCLFVLGNQRKQFLIDDTAVDEGSIREWFTLGTDS